jgi:hypothetical protein
LKRGLAFSSHGVLCSHFVAEKLSNSILDEDVGVGG